MWWLLGKGSSEASLEKGAQRRWITSITEYTMLCTSSAKELYSSSSLLSVMPTICCFPVIDSAQIRYSSCLYCVCSLT